MIEAFNYDLKWFGNQDKDNNQAIILLENIIEKREAALENYYNNKGQNANVDYINRENKHHLDLRKVHSAINGFRYEHLHAHLDYLLINLHKGDPSLSGIKVDFRTKPTGNNFLFFNYDLF